MREGGEENPWRFRKFRVRFLASAKVRDELTGVDWGSCVIGLVGFATGYKTLEPFYISFLLLSSASPQRV